MADEHSQVISGLLIDEETTLTLSEFARACAVRVDWVVELVDEGVLEVQGREPGRWAFSGAMLARGRTAVRLQRDLELSAASVALVLDLLDELESLRARLQALESLP